MRTPGWYFVAVVLCLGVSACAPEVKPVDNGQRIETANKLVVTDLVSAMVQLEQLNPNTTTLQMSGSSTSFGEMLRAAFEIAGYGLQLVSGDQGPNYVSYAVRTAETDGGEVNDYLIRVNEIEVRREYNFTSTGVYPASVMYISGVEENLGQLQLNDQIFAEQGGDEYFVSGVENASSGQFTNDIREVVADDSSRIVSSRRTDQQKIISRTREQSAESSQELEYSALAGLKPLKRLVVLFPDNRSLFIGAGNNLAIVQLLDDLEEEDLFEIRACDDIDGKNEMAEKRAIRVKEEFVSHGFPGNRVLRAPCTRSNYRHQSDDSPTPVAIFQYRKSA